MEESFHSLQNTPGKICVSSLGSKNTLSCRGWDTLPLLPYPHISAQRRESCAAGGSSLTPAHEAPWICPQCLFSEDFSSCLGPDLDFQVYTMNTRGTRTQASAGYSSTLSTHSWLSNIFFPFYSPFLKPIVVADWIYDASKYHRQ